MPLTTINTLNKTSIKITHIINTIDKIRLHKSISSKMFNDVKGDVEYIKDNVVFYNKILIYEDPHDDYSLIDKLISLINDTIFISNSNYLKEIKKYVEKNLWKNKIKFLPID